MLADKIVHNYCVRYYEVLKSGAKRPQSSLVAIARRSVAQYEIIEDTYHFGWVGCEQGSG